MKIFEKKDSVIKIEEDDLQDAKLSTIDFTDKTTKKRAFLNVLGARLAMKMLFSQKIEATNLYSLYTIHNVIEELDIADIYFNGVKIDVRVVFNKEEIFIPKSHFQLGLLPDLYFVLELAQDFSGVEFLGFFEPKTLNTQNENKDFYFYECDRLQESKTLKAFLKDFKGDNALRTPVKLENAEELFIALLDKEISKENKTALFKCLASDIALREKAVEFENFETLSKEAVKTNLIAQDGIFDIVGAQQVYEGEELTLSEEKAEIIGEVLNDLLEVEGPSTEKEASVELNKDDLEKLLSEEDHKPSDKENKDKGGFIAGAAAGAIVGGAIAGGVVAGAAAMGAAEAGLENNLFEALPDLDLDLNIDNKNNQKEDLTPLLNESQDEDLMYFEEDTKYESVDTKEDLFAELSDLDELENFVNNDETEDIEDSSDIQAKFFGNLSEEEITNGDEEIEEFKTDDDYTENQTEIVIEDKPNENDDFDNSVSFEDIEDSKNIQPMPVSYEQSFEENDEEDETLKKFRELEEDEYGGNNDNLESQDDVISQIDEFLQENELSGTKPEFTEEAIDLTNFDEDSLISTPQLPEEIEKTEEIKKAEKTEIPEEIDIPEIPTETSSNEIDIMNYENPAASLPENNPTGGNEQINLLFNEGKTEEIPALGLDATEPTPVQIQKPSGLKNKKMVIAASIAGLALVAFLATKNGSVNTPSAVPPSNAPVTAQGQAPDELASNNTAPNDLGMADQPSADMGADPLLQPAPPTQNNPQASQNRDMGKAVSDAFLSEPVNATISKVAWEVPEDLAYNDSFRKYLQMAGKNLKLNLQNNLLLATEMAYSNKVVVDLSIKKDGSVESSTIATSSGSKQIDNIVLQSVKETLAYLKIPSDEVSGNSVNATLIINF